MNVVDWIITVIGVVVLLGFAIGYPVIYFHAKFEEITNYWLCIAIWSAFVVSLIKITQEDHNETRTQKEEEAESTQVLTQPTDTWLQILQKKKS